MSQAANQLPITPPLPGGTLVQAMNSALLALLTTYKGNPAPSFTGIPVAGMFWIDDTNDPSYWIWKVYDGSSWNIIGYIDPSSHQVYLPIGGEIATAASASSVDLGSVGQSQINITGTTTINSFGSTAPAGQVKYVKFSGALTLTNSGSLVCPGGANILTQAGDTLIATSQGSGNWIIWQFTRAGLPVLNPAAPASGFEPINLQLNASVSGNLLTVAVKAADINSDPTANHPVLVPFRDVTLGNGDPVWLSIASALSISTFSTSATLGTANGVPFRLWVVLFNNSGAPVLGLFQSVTGGATPTAIAALAESALITSTGMTAGATSAGVFYTPNGVGVAAKAFRILGYVDFASGLATAGTYNVGPSVVQLFGPGIRKPGDVIQMKLTKNAAQFSTTSNSLQSTNTTLAMTLTSAVNLVKVTFSGDVIIQDSGNTVLGEIVGPNGIVGRSFTFVVTVTGLGVSESEVAMIGYDAPGTTSPTYTEKIASQNSGKTVYTGSTDELILEEIAA